MNKAQTAQLLLLVTAAYRNVELSKEEASLWHNMLQDMSFGKAQQNLANHIRTNRFPPTIADIRCEDANQFVNYEQLRQETQLLLQEREERQQRAIDCPPHLRTVFLPEGDGANVDDV